MDDTYSRTAPRLEGLVLQLGQEGEPLGEIVQAVLAGAISMHVRLGGPQRTVALLTEVIPLIMSGRYNEPESEAGAVN